MGRRYLLALVAALAAGHAAAQPLDDPEIEARALAIHERVMTLDTHVDVPLTFATVKTDPGGFTASQVDLPKMRAGGLDAAFFIVYSPQGPLTDQGLGAAHHIARIRLSAIRRFAGAYESEIGLARSVREARDIARDGRKVAFIGMENAFPLGFEPTQADIDRFAAEGVRYVGITHFGHNQFGDSSNPSPALGDEAEKWGGLSPKGRKLVSMLNKAGVMVDVSHAGKKTMMQAAELSAAPIIASHSGVMGVAESPRNLDDEQLRKLAEVGGVVQIVALDNYVKPFTEEQTAFRERLRKEMGLETSEQRGAASPEKLTEYAERLKGMWDIAPRASVSDLVDHIDHAVKVAGIDHVGIASDFDGGGGVDGWADASETLNVTRELVGRGYSEKDIAKIWSGNLLRVLSEVEKVAG
ncbi:MAG: dipeptidase [Pseudomonadota bacterium]